jgi:hypothetical protein
VTDSSDSGPVLHALLIGTDFYIPGYLADGQSSYPSLKGSVRDIEHVESFLRNELQVPTERITKLTATNLEADAQQEPPEPSQAWPTYENIVAAFEGLMEAAQPGDQVYVHYSGHGGRAPTLVPERKGVDGVDEALVPTDIHRPGTRYLRDIELTLIFQRMVDRGLHLSVVLDSCHSGGAVRGAADVAVRGLGIIDATPRPGDSLVASTGDLADMWQRLTPTTTRAVGVGSGWLPEPRGYVLLAACTASQSAFEYAFQGEQRNGVLSYWLLDSLRTYGHQISCRVLYDRILAKVHSQFQYQTPQLQGEGQNPLFGAGAVAAPSFMPVLEVDISRQRVRIGTGEVVGIRAGAQLAVYPFGTTRFGDATNRQALVTITDVGATSSWADVTAVFGAAALTQGAPAILVDPGTARLRRTVGFARRTDLPEGTQQDAALEAVRQAMTGNPWLAPAAPGETLDYQVAVNERGEFELWDPAGQPILNVTPPVRISDSDAAAIQVRRLVHLAKYHTVQQLANYDVFSTLRGKLRVELLGIQADYNPRDPPRPMPFRGPGHAPVVPNGLWTFLRIRNESSDNLLVAVLDLQPDWGIAQVWPTGIGDLFIEFEPGHEETLPLQAELAQQYAEGRDQLKVFATSEPINLRVLELPALDQPVVRSAARDLRRAGRSPNPLEDVLAALVVDPPPGTPVPRKFSAATVSGQDWTTAAVEVIIQRDEREPAHG